jgi:hypothetical protein
MENSQTSNSTKKKFQRKARSIQGLIGALNYEIYTSVELETIILLTNHIRVIPSDEIDNFRIVKYSEAWFIFKRLKDAYSERQVVEVMTELLLEYEDYETLAVLEI